MRLKEIRQQIKQIEAESELNRARVKRCEDKKRASGLVAVKVWIPLDKKTALSEFVKSLTTKGEE